MLRTARAFMRACDEKGLKYKNQRDLDSGKSLVVCGVNGSAGNTYDVMFIFDQDEESVAVRVYKLTSCNKENFARVLITVNQLNNKFRWYKFVIDDDRDVNMECDAVIDVDSAGEVCTELLYHCMGIAKDAYPMLIDRKSVV